MAVGRPVVHAYIRESAFQNAIPEARSDAARAFLDRGWRPADEVAAITLALAAANDQDPEPAMVWFTEAWRRHPAALSNWSPALIAVMRQDVQGQDRQTDEILDRVEKETPRQASVGAHRGRRLLRAACRHAGYVAGVDISRRPSFLDGRRGSTHTRCICWRGRAFPRVPSYPPL